MKRYENGMNTEQMSLSRGQAVQPPVTGGQTACSSSKPKFESSKFIQPNRTKLKVQSLGVPRRCSTKAFSNLSMKLIDRAKSRFEVPWRDETRFKRSNRLGNRFNRGRRLDFTKGATFSLVESSNRQGRRCSRFGVLGGERKREECVLVVGRKKEGDKDSLWDPRAVKQSTRDRRFDRLLQAVRPLVAG